MIARQDVGSLTDLAVDTSALFAVSNAPYLLSS